MTTPNDSFEKRFDELLERLALEGIHDYDSGKFDLTPFILALKLLDE